MIDTLKKGDEIVTVGGIIGTIVHLDDERLTVKTAEKHSASGRARKSRSCGRRGTWEIERGRLKPGKRIVDAPP